MIKSLYSHLLLKNLVSINTINYLKIIQVLLNEIDFYQYVAIRQHHLIQKFKTSRLLSFHHLISDHKHTECDLKYSMSSEYTLNEINTGTLNQLLNS